MTSGIEAWLTIALGTLAIVVAVLQSHQARRQRVRDFELVYVQRYWALRDRIEAARGTDGDRMAFVSLYLELCEDEADMRKHGWISDATWRLWRDGITSALRRDPYAAAWGSLQKEGPERFEHLKALAESQDEPADGGYDPIAVMPPTKWLRGLSGKD